MSITKFDIFNWMFFYAGIIALVWCILALILMPLDSLPIAPAGLAVAQKAAVVKVSVERTLRNGQVVIDMGSGALISPNKVLTNWHVIRDHTKDGLITVTFNGGIVRSASVAGFDKDLDLALLTFAPVKQEVLTKGKRVSKGSKVTICGFAGGTDYKEVKGLVVGWGSVTRTGPDNVFKVDNVSESGMSGGPVLDARGRLVGLLFGSRGYSNCISIEEIMRFLSDYLDFPPLVVYDLSR